MDNYKVGDRVMIDGDDTFDVCTGYVKKIVTMYAVTVDEVNSCVLFPAEKLVPEFKVNMGGIDKNE